MKALFSCLLDVEIIKQKLQRGMKIKELQAIIMRLNIQCGAIKGPDKVSQCCPVIKLSVVVLFELPVHLARHRHCR